MKICIKCKNNFSLDNFNKVNKVGYKQYTQSQCKVCQAEYSAYYRLTHPNYHKIYYEDNKKCYKENKIKFQLVNPDYDKSYYQFNKKRIIAQQNEHTKQRMLKDVNFKLKKSLRNRLYQAIKNLQKVGSAVRDLGCTIPELKEHLEKQWQSGMTWDNWTTDGWHVDHKKALANYDLTNREQFLEACHYTNLQPLWWHENLAKSDKR
jgi:hypothetical protein